MGYYVMEFFFRHGVKSLQLSGGNIFVIVFGLFVSSIIVAKTKKIRNGIISLSVSAIVMSFIAINYEGGVTKDLPQFLTPQIVIPVSILIIGSMFMLELFLKGSDYTLRFAFTMLFTSLVSGGYIFSYIHPDVLGELAKYIPFI